MMARENRRLTWIAVALLALIPIVIGATYPNVIFPSIGSIDSYAFVGLGLNYDLPSIFPLYYKSSRVAWVLVEYLGRHLLPPLPAQWAIQAVARLLAGLATFFGLRALFGLWPAFLSACFLLVFTEFYSASPPDYMNTFAAGLYALSFALATSAAQRSSSRALFLLAGAAFALSVHTSIYYAPLGLLLALHTLVVRKTTSWGDVAMIALWALLGALAATVVLGLVALRFGRSFQFWQSQLGFFFDYVPAAQHQWWYAWSSGWYFRAPYFACFAMMAVVAALAAALIWMRDRDEGGGLARLRVGVLLQFVLIFLIWCALQSLGQELLYPNHAMYPLLVPFVGAIAALAARLPPPASSRAAIAMMVAIGALFVLFLVWRPVFYAIRNFDDRHTPFYAGLLGFAVVGVVALVAGRVGRGGAGAVLIALVLAITNVAAASDNSFLTLFAPSACTFNRDGYLSIVGLVRAVKARDPGLSFVYVWLDLKETTAAANCGAVRVGDLATSLTATGFDYIDGDSGGMPAVSDIPDARIKFIAQRFSSLIVASHDRRPADDLQHRLQALGVATRREPLHVEQGDLKLDFILLRRD
jgi:hypothetical protein